MSKSESLYLDFIRTITAMIVLLSHANYGRFTGGLPIISQIKFLGNDAVMIFFVLSGFVIAYVSNCKETSLIDYSISRLARLYSVVIPAIVLTIVVDYIGLLISPELYNGWWFQSNNPAWRVFANLFFINELWFSSVRPFSNGPFWSLGYEFWYYVIFGAAYYLQGRTKYLVVAISIMISGPKIILLFPVWLLGVAAYRFIKSAQVPEQLGWGLYLGSVAGYILYQKVSGPQLLLNWSMINLDGFFLWRELPWSYAAPFLNCYVVGILVALHFIGFFAISGRFTNTDGLFSKIVRHLSNYTFAIYLFHYPLLQFLTAITGDISDRTLRNTVIVLGTLILIYAIGTVTETKKYWLKKKMFELYRRQPVLVNGT